MLFFPLSCGFVFISRLGAVSILFRSVSCSALGEQRLTELKFGHCYCFWLIEFWAVLLSFLVLFEQIVAQPRGILHARDFSQLVAPG